MSLFLQLVIRHVFLQLFAYKQSLVAFREGKQNFNCRQSSFNAFFSSNKMFNTFSCGFNDNFIQFFRELETNALSYIIQHVSKSLLPIIITLLFNPYRPYCTVDYFFIHVFVLYSYIIYWNLITNFPISSKRRQINEVFENHPQTINQCNLQLKANRKRNQNVNKVRFRGHVKLTFRLNQQHIQYHFSLTFIFGYTLLSLLPFSFRVIYCHFLYLNNEPNFQCTQFLFYKVAKLERQVNKLLS